MVIYSTIKTALLYQCWFSYVIRYLLEVIRIYLYYAITHMIMGEWMDSCQGRIQGKLAPMANDETAPLSKHMTPTFVITITSAMNIMIMQLIVAKILL